MTQTRRSDTVRAWGHTSIGIDGRTKSKLKQLAGDSTIVEALRELVDEAMAKHEGGQASMVLGDRPVSKASLVGVATDLREVKSVVLVLSEVILGLYAVLGVKVADEALSEVDSELQARYGIDAKARALLDNMRLMLSSRPSSEQLSFDKGAV